MSDGQHTGTPADTGDINRRAVLRQLVLHGPRSRGDIAARINLTAATLSRIARELIAAGLVAELPKRESDSPAGPGRPSVDLDIAPEGGQVLGIAISPAFQTVALSDLKNRIIAETMLDIVALNDPDLVIQEVADHSRRLIASLPPDRRRVLGGFVMLPATVERRHGNVRRNCSAAHRFGQPLRAKPVDSVNSALGSKLRMGYWKDVRERLGGGNPEAHHHEFVCSECFSDEGLSGFVEGEACRNTCTFCGMEAAEPIAAPLVEILLYITGCFVNEYDTAENTLTYDGETGEYMGKTWTTRDLLESHIAAGLPNDDDGELMEALCDGLEDRLWCRSHPYSFTDDEKLNYSWDAFCTLIKHDRRYFFLREPEDRELFSPSTLLRELAGWCGKFDLISTVPANRLLYRARRQKPGERLSTPDELGPPPQEKATVANRMSPPGIVMFYGSDEPGTALREVARIPECGVDHYAIGEFRTLRDTRILDLTRIPRTPSIFEPISDTLEYDPRPPLIFLNYFAAELSMPITGDRSIHVEYVPPQVVTEFVRTEFRHEGLALDGIRYQSARHQGKASLVLFASQANLADSKDARARPVFAHTDRWIELVGRTEREVTAKEAEIWDQEAPQPVEWV